MLTALLLSISLGTLAQTEAATPPPVEMKRFEPADLRFHVLFPGTPEKQVLEVDTAFGKAEMRVFVVAKNAAEAYGVVVTDYPKEAKLDAEKVLDTNRDEQVAKVEGTLIESHPIKFHEHPSMSYDYEFTIKDGTKLIGRSKLYLVKNRLYQVGVIGREPLVNGDVSGRIFKSFDLLEAAKTPVHGKTKAAPKPKPFHPADLPSSKAMRDDADRAAKLDKLRTEQATSLKKLREEIEKTKLEKEDREQIWIDDRAALDRAIWEAYHIFDPQTEFREKADYLDKKQAEYRELVIKAHRITKETLLLIRQEGTVDMWEVPRYPSCDVRKVARELNVQVRGVQGDEVYHRASCLILINALEKPDTKEVPMKLYKALTSADVRPCPTCLP